MLASQVLRPWCHFELPDSDYIGGGRRNPELPGPSGSIEPLDPATKVWHGSCRSSLRCMPPVLVCTRLHVMALAGQLPAWLQLKALIRTVIPSLAMLWRNWRLHQCSYLQSV